MVLHNYINMLHIYMTLEYMAANGARQGLSNHCQIHSVDL